MPPIPCNTISYQIWRKGSFIILDSNTMKRLNFNHWNILVIVEIYTSTVSTE